MSCEATIRATRASCIEQLHTVSRDSYEAFGDWMWHTEHTFEFCLPLLLTVIVLHKLIVVFGEGLRNIVAYQALFSLTCAW